jgi:hypothetical protein
MSEHKSMPKRGRRSGNQSSLPPEVNLVHTVSTVLRYSAVVGGANLVTTPNVINACGGMASTTSLIRPWATSFRIKSVVLFSPSSTTVDDTLSLEWNSGFSAFIKDEIRNMTTPTGMTLPQKIVYRPPKESLAHGWISNGSSGGIMTITCPAGTVVDVHIDYTIFAGGLTQTSGFGTVSTVTVGVIYYVALDGTATNNLIPLVLPTAH